MDRPPEEGPPVAAAGGYGDEPYGWEESALKTGFGG